MGGKGEKYWQVKQAEVVWGGKMEAEHGDMPLMPPICPPAINLSLQCQHVKFSSWMLA